MTHMDDLVTVLEENYGMMRVQRIRRPKLNRKSGHVRPGARAARERRERLAARRAKAAR